MRLEMTIKWARLAMTTEFPRITLETTRPKVDMESQLPMTELDIDLPHVILDLTGPYEELGLKSSHTLRKEAARKGQETVLRTVEDIARMGDRLAAVEQGGDLIEEVVSRAWPGDQRQLNVGVAPTQRIGVEVKGGLSTNVEPGWVRMNVEMEPVNPVHVTLQRGYVQIEV